MASSVELAAPTGRHREPVVETALRLTRELLWLRLEGTSSDQLLTSIYGLTHAMSEVAAVAAGSVDATPKGAPPAGNPFFPLSRGWAKVSSAPGAQASKGRKALLQRSRRGALPVHLLCKISCFWSSARASRCVLSRSVSSTSTFSSLRSATLGR
jgi:hypothetical protein